MIQPRLSLALLFSMGAALVFGLSAFLSRQVIFQDRGDVTLGVIFLSILAYGITAYAARRDDAARIFAAMLVLLGTGFALFFLLQYEYQGYGEVPGIIQRLGSLTTRLPDLGIYFEDSAVATVLEMMIPLGGALLLAQHGSGRYFWLVCVGLMLLGVVLTYSLGSWLGLAAGTALAVALVTFKHRPVMGLSLLLGFVLVVIAVLLGGSVLGDRIPFMQSVLGAAASRLELFKNSLYLAGDYAFTGLGLGDTFTMPYSRYSLMIFVPLFTYSHNLYLTIWLSQGLLGIIAFLGMIAAWYGYVGHVLRHAAPGPVFYGAVAGVTATLVHGLIDSRQYTESPWIMPVLFVGLGIAVASGAAALTQQSVLMRRSAGGKPRLTLAVAGAVLIIGVVSAVVFQSDLRALWYTNQGAIDEALSDDLINPDVPLNETDQMQIMLAAQADYQLALEISPDLAAPNRRLGNLLVGLARYDEAIPHLETAYAAEPTYQAAVKGLGLAYTWAGRFDDASRVLKTLSDPSSASQELYVWSGFWEQQNQWLLSAHALEVAFRLDNWEQDNIDVWVLVGDFYYRAADMENARRWYEMALEKDPENVRAKEGLNKTGG
ncbi:MAG: O-antigen ligase family protein [Anaerolineae bacterium]|nr:O-antigen ligase family protein [Anaerolineae bacterium]